MANSPDFRKDIEEALARSGADRGERTAPRREAVLNAIAAHRNELARMGVASLALFGSVARDTAHAGSDIDVLVELSRPMGLLAFTGIQLYLEEILGHRVDLVTPGGLHPRLRDRILHEAIRAA